MEQITLREQKRINEEQRMQFVEFWAEFVRSNPDKVWSEQQAVLINSQLRNKSMISVEEYLRIKNELRN